MPKARPTPIEIRSWSLKVFGFWNPEIFEDVNAVCETIVAALDGRLDPYDQYRT